MLFKCFTMQPIREKLGVETTRMESPLIEEFQDFAIKAGAFSIKLYEKYAIYTNFPPSQSYTFVVTGVKQEQQS